MSNTKSRRDKLAQDQRNILTELGVEWAAKLESRLGVLPRRPVG
ncbi:nitrile hydratase subunit alpha [Streptomyces sp. NBC_00191]